ncbi:MAG TPA: carotenoid biosynthesis protein [Blastocatellia bacterium]|nr:carotenoid biosynthesis protein [Blastocatellia bacterium]
MNAHSIATRTAFYLLIAIYLVMWAGGIGSHLLRGAPPTNASWASPLFLFLSGLIVFVTTAKNDWWKLLVIGLLGLTAEAVGVQSGFLFGVYRYTSVLQPQLLGVPVVMACAWFVLVAYLRQMLQPFRLPAWLDVLVAGAWMTAIDLVIDPLAAGQLGYWRWEQAGDYYGIPARNFAGWFVVSLVIFTAVRKPWRLNAAAIYLGLSMVVFFTAISFAHNLMLAFGIGLGLCATHFIVAQVARSGGRLINPATSGAHLSKQLL